MFEYFMRDTILKYECIEPLFYLKIQLRHEYLHQISCQIHKEDFLGIRIG